MRQSTNLCDQAVICRVGKGQPQLLLGIQWSPSPWSLRGFLMFYTLSGKYFSSWVLELLMTAVSIITPLPFFFFFTFFILHSFSLSTSLCYTNNIFSVKLSQDHATVLHQQILCLMDPSWVRRDVSISVYWSPFRVETVMVTNKQYQTSVKWIENY